MANIITRMGRRLRGGKLDSRSGTTNPRPETYPIPFAPYIQAGGQVEKVPIMLFSIRWLYDITYASDVLRTIVRTITGETFKNGFDIREKFKSKCLKCGREFEEDLDVCPYDGSLTRPPDYDESVKLSKFLSTKNQFGESFIKVLKEVDNDVNITDNGYLFLQKDYIYDGNNNLIGAEVTDILRLTPEKMRLILTAHGGGRGENGERYYFCPLHRKELITLPENDTEIPRCPTCGGSTLEAWFGAREEEKPVYFAESEIYHLKRWSNSQGYGVPPLYSIYLKVLALLKMDRFIVDAYNLQRSPQALLIIKGRYDQFRGAWEYMMQKARENPYMIYPLVVEGEENTKRIVEYQEFSLKPSEFQWVESRKEYREAIGAVYGIQPIYLEGLEGGGLANEGLQITATSQTINDSQRNWNMFLEWLSKMLGAYDYNIVLHGNELEDELKKLDIAQKRIDLAVIMKQLGFGIRLKKDNRGILNFEYVDSPERQDLLEHPEKELAEQEQTRQSQNEQGAKPPKSETEQDRNSENKVNESGFGG
jgi:hypothetical protein